MEPSTSGDVRMVSAVHAVRRVESDPVDELDLASDLRARHSHDELLALATKHAYLDSGEDRRMRRAVWRALAKRFGHGVQIGRGVLVLHPETFEIGDGVFIGDQTMIQGRFDGRCVIADHAWIGPQSYLDARDLVIDEYVGWGPGAKVLGSTHTGEPVDVPIVQTPLEIRPVRIQAWADIGTNAVILPGVTVGRGAIIGAGAVVTSDVAPFAVVAGVPAVFLHWRGPHAAS
jgi:acetyltransferase-like isoleucine patch superfamily enzyme